MRNKIAIKIVNYAPSMLTDITGEPTTDRSRQVKLERELTQLTRTCKKIGDTEVINHTMYGNLKDSGIIFEKI